MCDFANTKTSIKQGCVVRENTSEHMAAPFDSLCEAKIIVINPASKFLRDELKTEKMFYELSNECSTTMMFQRNMQCRIFDTDY
ncbi:MAG: hypothetical protein IJE48_01410 [Clostridia bacterium]|nr:hypothetical protein [Clostridia bacterium]